MLMNAMNRASVFPPRYSILNIRTEIIIDRLPNSAPSTVLVKPRLFPLHFLLHGTTDSNYAHCIRRLISHRQLQTTKKLVRDSTVAYFVYDVSTPTAVLREE